MLNYHGSTTIATLMMYRLGADQIGSLTRSATGVSDHNV